ncbi:MAG: polysaccharide deacetylase family protein [Verrucomicrobiales bacterium]
MRIFRPVLTVCLILGYSTFSEAERPAARLKPIPDKLVVLTFDDCNKSDRAFVAEELRKHGFGATFYVTEGLGFLRNKKHYTTWDEIVELNAMGFEIGNHTRSHPHLPSLTKQQITAEIAHIENRCAEHKIPRPTTFCYPGFGHNLACVEVLAERKYQFARRGVGPEHKDGGRGARGPAYAPGEDHPLLVPTTGYAGPDWDMEDLKWAVSQAKEGEIAVLCFHGVPALDHPWVHCDPEDFKKYMRYLKAEGCTVIAMRDLVQYVDPARGPDDPYAPITARGQAEK